MKKLSMLALACCITVSSFAAAITHSVSDTGKMKMKMHKKHSKMKKMKDTASKM